MIDNKFFFDKSVELGFTTRDYESLVNLHINGARTLQIMGCTSVFEFGSGLGFFLSACQRVGLYKHVGYDINPYERDFAISKGIDPGRYLIAPSSLPDISTDSKSRTCTSRVVILSFIPSILFDISSLLT